MPCTKSAKLLCGGQAVKAKTSAPGGLDSKPGDSLSPIEQAEQAIEGYLSRESSLRFFNDQPSASAYYSPSKDEVAWALNTKKPSRTPLLTSKAG